MTCGFCVQATSEVVIDGGLPWGSIGKVHPSCLASALAERDRRVCISTPYVGRDWAYAWSNQPDEHGLIRELPDADSVSLREAVRDFHRAHRLNQPNHWRGQWFYRGRAIDRADPDPAQYVNGRFAGPIWVRYAEDES